MGSGVEIVLCRRHGSKLPVDIALRPGRLAGMRRRADQGLAARGDPRRTPLPVLPAQAATGAPARTLEAAIRDGRVEDEGWRMRKDGSQFWANVVVTAVYDEAGALHGFAKITRDLTERRRLEGQQRQRTIE